MDKESRLALDGLDPITIFEGQPTRGKTESKLIHMGKVYFFKNAENRGRFERNPGSFLPQFAGHCATTIALLGNLELGKTEHRIIKAGKLYLFSSAGTKSAWERLPFLKGWGEFFYERKFRLKVKS